MFGPAWAYEHFTAFNISSGIKPSIAHQVDDSMWTGICLPDELYCDCREGKPHHTDFYQSHAIIEFAQEYPTGSSRFFETRFVQAFQRCIDNASNQPRKVQYWPTLGSQDPMPSLIPMSAKQWQAVNEGPVFRVLYGELRSKPTSSLTIFTKLAGCYEEEDSHSISKPQMTRLCLYNLRMIADGSLEATIEVQGKLFEEEIAHGIYLAYADHVSRTLTYSNWDVHLHEHILSHIPIQHESGDLVEIGVYMDSGFDRSTPLVLMEITRIIIKPKRAVAAAYAIGDVHVKDRGDSPNVQKRIIWKWERIPQRKGRDWPQGIPWSRTTGPFSSFTVRTSGKVIGEAYCLEFPLKNSDVEDLGDEITIIVVGHMFGAGDVNSPSISIPRADLLINGDKSE
ncbi:MAG: hypothetical protein LQ343_006238 [Gyalolechia ehrenbergii]|nr:MAG: hypothetical protein LQ343_006238 [Gyalolechia ehrenbergii]